MSVFRRSAQSSRAYPAAGITVSGSAGRFRRHKTSGAREADAAGQAWEARDRAQDRRGGWYRRAR